MLFFILSRNPYLKFDYSDPYPNFDRRLVNGVVAKLFRIRDFRFATALEVAGGGAVSFEFCRVGLLLKLLCLIFL